MSGKLNFKLSNKSKIELSKRIKCIMTEIPREFQRKKRSLKNFAKWKATELRFILLY